MGGRDAMAIAGAKYAIWWAKYPDDRHDQEFVQALLTDVLTEFRTLMALTDCSVFRLRMGEFHSDAQHYAWEVKAETPFSTQDGPYHYARLEQRQPYFARYIMDHTLDYAGQIEAEVELLGLGSMELAEMQAQIRRMLRTALMMYYEKVAAMYPDWETDYINAPQGA